MIEPCPLPPRRHGFALAGASAGKTRARRCERPATANEPDFRRAPPPPCFAWSPSPALTSGRGKSADASPPPCSVSETGEGDHPKGGGGGAPQGGLGLTPARKFGRNALISLNSDSDGAPLRCALAVTSGFAGDASRRPPPAASPVPSFERPAFQTRKDDPAKLKAHRSGIAAARKFGRNALTSLDSDSGEVAVRPGAAMGSRAPRGARTASR